MKDISVNDKLLSATSWSASSLRMSFNSALKLIPRDWSRRLRVRGVICRALAVRNVPRPEAEIAKRVREIVGPDVPIAGSFDLHGNEDEQFLEWANAAFVTKRYPHYDAFHQGSRSG